MVSCTLHAPWRTTLWCSWGRACSGNSVIQASTLNAGCSPFICGRRGRKVLGCVLCRRSSERPFCAFGGRACPGNPVTQASTLNAGCSPFICGRRGRKVLCSLLCRRSSERPFCARGGRACPGNPVMIVFQTQYCAAIA